MSIEVITSKVIDCLYKMTLIIYYTSSTVIARALLKCMILKTFIRNLIVLLNIIEANIADKTENAKVIFELKDLLVF